MRLVARIFKITLIGFVILMGVIAILFGYKDKPLSELKAKYAASPSAFIAVEGMEVHYRDEGIKTDSLPLILIHGTGSSLQTFDAWAVLLKRKNVLSEWIFRALV